MHYVVTQPDWSKKTEIVVFCFKGLDITVYRYLWLPICANRYFHFIAINMDISVMAISVTIYPKPIYPYL
jgi:hypothetical protein